MKTTGMKTSETANAETINVATMRAELENKSSSVQPSSSRPLEMSSEGEPRAKLFSAANAFSLRRPARRLRRATRRQRRRQRQHAERQRCRRREQRHARADAASVSHGGRTVKESDASRRARRRTLQTARQEAQPF